MVPVEACRLCMLYSLRAEIEMRGARVLVRWAPAARGRLRELDGPIFLVVALRVRDIPESVVHPVLF